MQNPRQTQKNEDKIKLKETTNLVELRKKKYQGNQTMITISLSQCRLIHKQNKNNVLEKNEDANQAKTLETKPKTKKM